MNRRFLSGLRWLPSRLAPSAPAKTAEAARNELLRRADWRFLLPNATPARVLCLAQGTLAAAVQAVAHETVRNAAPRTCELAVAVNPTRDELRQMWEALAPGGALYVEWTMPLFTLGTIRDELRKAHFEHAKLYWAYPFPHRASASFWLPLDSPRALDYFLSQRRGRRGPLQDPVSTVWSWSTKVGWMLPVSSVARKPLSRTTQSFQIQDQAWAWSGAQADWAWLLLTPGQRSINKPVMLGFEPNHATPSVALKYARVRQTISALRNEERNLNLLAARTRGGLRGVPRVLSWQESAEMAVLGETVLTGRPVYITLTRQTFQPLAQRVTGWLGELAEQSIVPAVGHDWRKGIVAPVLADYIRNFGRVLPREQSEQLNTRLAQLNFNALVFEQRDFSPWNVLLDSANQLVVLDWESAEPFGLPGLDLVYFLTYLAFFQDGAFQTGRYLETYRKVCNPRTFFGSVFAGCAIRYAAPLKMSQTDWSTLRILTWMLHSRSEYGRMRADANGEPSEAQLQTSLFHCLVNEELHRRDAQ